jgi:hypothetical protein
VPSRRRDARPHPHHLTATLLGIGLVESRHALDVLGVRVHGERVTTVQKRQGAAASEPIERPDGQRQPGACVGVVGTKRATRLSVPRPGRRLQQRRNSVPVQRCAAPKIPGGIFGAVSAMEKGQRSHGD